MSLLYKLSGKIPFQNNQGYIKLPLSVRPIMGTRLVLVFLYARMIKLCKDFDFCFKKIWKKDIIKQSQFPGQIAHGLSDCILLWFQN